MSSNINGWLVFTEDDEGLGWMLVQVTAVTEREALAKAIADGYGEPDKRAIVCREDASTAFELSHPDARVEVRTQIGLAGISK